MLIRNGKIPQVTKKKAMRGKKVMATVKGTAGRYDDDKQYDRLMQRIMDELDKLEQDDAAFWAAVDRLRDYVAMRRVLRMSDTAT